MREGLRGGGEADLPGWGRLNSEQKGERDNDGDLSPGEEES